MPKLMLGDNPFFGISHLSPEKSNDYLLDENRWSNAVTIIQSAPALGIDSFMISSHGESRQLLESAGYLDCADLPEVCLVVPNVHEVNVNAASRGLPGALKAMFSTSFSLSDLLPRRLYRRIVMGGLSYKKIRYVALHNVVVDMFLGLRAVLALKLFCKVTKFCGYKPVLITLNPLKLFEAGIACHAVCCYYNNRGYNVCAAPDHLLDVFENQQNVNELWAMGVVASGVVPYAELKTDPLLARFSRVLVATSKLERLKELSGIFK